MPVIFYSYISLTFIVIFQLCDWNIYHEQPLGAYSLLYIFFWPWVGLVQNHCLRTFCRQRPLRLSGCLSVRLSHIQCRSMTQQLILFTNKGMRSRNKGYQHSYMLNGYKTVFITPCHSVMYTTSTSMVMVSIFPIIVGLSLEIWTSFFVARK